MDAKETREQAVREAKVGLILDAARTVFAEKGFHDSRLEDIAAAAGFSKASLYNYYPDKETIFLSLANRDFDRMIAALKADRAENMTFSTGLEKSIRTALTFFGENFAFFLALTTFQSSAHPVPCPQGGHHDSLLAQFHKRFSDIHDGFVEMLAESRARSEFASLLDDHTIVYYLAALIRGVVFRWTLNRQRGDVEAEVKMLVTFVCNGVQVTEKGVL